MKTVLLDSEALLQALRQKSLVKWVSKATGINSFGVKVRLLGNDLHILCEAIECPQRWQTLSELLQALQQTDVDTLTNDEQPSIYQVLVYGRKKGEYRPQWCHRVYLNQLDQHLQQVNQSLLDQTNTPVVSGGAMIISNESLARQGDVAAIARYLSENLGYLGVSVQAETVFHPPENKEKSTFKRLWVLCQSSYSPDASLLAETVAQKLRHLKLSGYHDAIIVSQVRGEIEPDWRLRIDLTPSDVMLKDWARWGDVQAITRILSEVLLELKITVQASLKESTLHLVCTTVFDSLENAPAPAKETCIQAIIPLLEAIAPQAIQATTIYGQITSSEKPSWVHWSALPASNHPDLSTSTLDIAHAGDIPAIIFLLERLLNPDLEWRLKTGGIRVLLQRKQDLLHIICEAPLCPTRHQVANKVIQFIRQLKIPGIIGIRVYGRRAGDKQPAWHHSMDIQERPRLVPEPTPEFAATSQYVNSLVYHQAIIRPELTKTELQNIIREVTQNWLTNTHKNIQKLLIVTQLFSYSHQDTEENLDTPGIWRSLTWVILGLLLTFQADFILGYVTARTTAISRKNQQMNNQINNSISYNSQPEINNQSSLLVTTQTSQVFEKNHDDTLRNTAFNSSGFINNTPSDPLKQKATSTAILLAARSEIPSFNARQLDEQLALYKKRLATNKKPPDLLIIGSSRALRGIDPVALANTLTTQGHQKIDIFNFGVNGATAQVVDFILRYVIQPSELPKMVIWADGSRAFNSGREDITFNAIAASPGYKKFLEKAASKKQLPPGNQQNNQQQNPEINLTSLPSAISNYEVANQWLNEKLSSISQTYKNREQIKILLHKQLKYVPFNSQNLQMSTKKRLINNNNNSDIDTAKQAVDFDGFLPLSIQFDPSTYYQQHSRVTGDYDNDYKSFQLTGKQEQALKSILEFTKNNNISLVFVNMPLTAEYLDPVRNKYEQEFQTYLLTFTNNTNFIYRDLSLLWPKENKYFSDPSHLNRFGAYEVSKKLATDPTITWPKP
ncbi:DUF1574 family protein [Anabaena sp. FACHB-1237]|uniref:DUF1574 family protein n=1 Tax=Anabaena sp. FACHB-1237 TaxID=2692769 RepID=UPI001680C9B6|nr:DUF1574 family protein [Anabaena sp. FACHB-1237]MBD2138327.1 DUF1574 family protein [Anabaena sp. FACHB-1237]